MQRKNQQDVFEPATRGVAQSGVRLTNERAVLTLIAGIPGVSNAEIARRSGLGPQTTARILSDLEARGMVIRGEVLRGRRGQPATPYRLNAEARYSIGVEIGWNHVEILLQNIAGQPLSVVRRTLDFADPDLVFGLVAAEVGTILGSLSEAERLRLEGIGLATPGAFGPLLERLGATPPQVEAWAGIDIPARIAADTGLPVMWINDGSSAAWYEVTAFSAPRPAGLVCLFVGTFVSAGFVSDGHVMEGPYGNAGDLGAMLVSDPSGGPRSLHMLASIHALQQGLQAGGMDLPAGGPRQWDWPALEPEVSHWLDTAGHALAQAVVSSAAAFEADTALINGDLPRPILDRLLVATQASLQSLPILSPRPLRLVASASGPSTAALGAARLLLFRRYFSRAWDVFEGELDK